MADLSEDLLVRRVLDRLGFGAGGDALATARSGGLADTVTHLVRPDGRDTGAERTPAPDATPTTMPGTKGEKPTPEEKKERRRERRSAQQDLTLWWLDRMVAADQPGRERASWFWHGHFATSVQKVKEPALMLAQNATFREHALETFAPLAKAMITDPALLVWLDGNDNTAEAPNENLSREYLELFSLGPGNYTETDVREAARALTGWKIARGKGKAVLRPRLHDDSTKTILGRTDDFDAAGLVDLVLAHEASAAFVVGRWWFRTVGPTPPSTEVVGRLVAAYGPDGDIAALLQAIVAEPGFRAEDASLVKQPVEWLVGLMRALGVRPSTLEPKLQRRLLTGLRGMGQVPFLPPSVGGWPAGGSWLTTASALSRIELARLVVKAADLDAGFTRTSAKGWAEASRTLLGVDRFASRTSDAVAQAGQADNALVVAACSPEYVVSA